jgi:hypothetical protein
MNEIEIEEMGDAVVDEEKYNNMHPTDPTLDRFSNPIVGHVSLNKQIKPDGNVSWYYNCNWMSSVHKKQFTTGFNVESGKYGTPAETYEVASGFQQMMDLLSEGKSIDIERMQSEIEVYKKQVNQLSQTVVKANVDQVMVIFDDKTHQLIQNNND